MRPIAAELAAIGLSFRSEQFEQLQIGDVLDDHRLRDMRNVFVGADFRLLHRGAESIGRCHRPVDRRLWLLVVVQQRQERGLTLPVGQGPGSQTRWTEYPASISQSTYSSRPMPSS